VSTPEQAVRELTLARQLCAKRFGEAKRNGEDLEVLKAEMQRIGAALDEAKAQLRAALQHDEQPPTEAARPQQAAEPFPQRFRPKSRAQHPVSEFSITAFQPQDRSDWDAYVDAHPAASMYHYTLWREMIVRQMRHADVSLLARNPHGKVVGVLPLVAMRSRLFGCFAVSMPYFNYGGPLADNEQLELALLQAAGVNAAQQDLEHVEIRETRKRDGWPSRENKVSMIRRLPASQPELDAELGSKLRAQIRRAERENPQVRIGGAELLDDFYRVFARNMRDLGTPVYSQTFFSAVLAAWSRNGHVVVVSLGGRPVAGALLLGYRDMLEIPWASTVREVNALGINMLMYRAILGFAIEQGYAYFDFGRSSIDAGTYRFKKQWGAEPLQNHWHYWLPEGRTLPQLNPGNPKYKLMIGVWRLMPVWVTRVIGPPVVRSLP
jgi:serine/alanine adding enzyme